MIAAIGDSGDSASYGSFESTYLALHDELVVLESEGWEDRDYDWSPIERKEAGLEMRTALGGSKEVKKEVWVERWCWFLCGAVEYSIPTSSVLQWLQYWCFQCVRAVTSIDQ